MTHVTFANPPGLFDATPLGYSQLAQVEAGSRLILPAGQGGIAADGSSPAGFREQLRLALANIAVALDAAGASLADVARVTLLVVDYDAAKLGIIAEEISRAWPAARPASTLIPVPRLAIEGMLVEVEVIAAGRPGDPPR